MQTLTLSRDLRLDYGTFGRLQVGAVTFATVERPWLNNAEGVSCIPLGTYSCVLAPSHTNARAGLDYAYSIQSVPGRALVRCMHVANYPTDVEGCVGGGTARAMVGGRWMVINSIQAIKAFYALTAGQPFTLVINEV